MPRLHNNIHDTEVIRRVVAGDVNAFEIILEKYHKYVFTVVGRHVPEPHVDDTVQDVFIRIYKSLPRFDNRSSFKSWMTAITIRTCYDMLRKKYRSREVSFTSLAGQEQDQVDHILSEQAKRNYAESLDLAEAKKLLHAALARLTPENKLLIELIYFEGYSVKETARLLGWSVANVKIRSFRCRKQLNTILKQFIEG